MSYYFDYNSSKVMVKIVQKYLQINKYSNLKNEFEDLFLSHPNYPSLFAITDSLDLLSIENAAVRISKEQILDLPKSFLAYYKQELTLVEKNKKNVRIYSDKEGIQKISYEEFLTGWDGVIVAIEENKLLLNEESSIGFKWLKYALPVFLLAGLSFVYNHYNTFSIAFLITSLLGFAFSVLIVDKKIGLSPNLNSRFCNLGSAISCDSVIRSDLRRINKWISFTDLPLIFFSSSLLSILLLPFESAVFVGFLSLLSIPIIVLSVWIQKFEIRKWCTLCLIVSFLIVSQSIVWFTSSNFTLVFSTSNVFPFLFSFVLLLTIWLGIKSILKNRITNEVSLNELKKFKRNYSVLNFLSQRIPKIDGFSDLRGLQFGNKKASINLSIIISPSCTHCHKTFQEAFDLVLKFPDKIFLNVLFNVNPENNENPFKTVVERLLMIYRSTPGKTVEAISDWHIKKMELDKWLKKWSIDGTSAMITQEINKQYEWCQKNNFNYTPVKIVNEKVFPNEYDISELKYFLNDFAEEIHVLERTA
ncbi:vitamin K epoxide reductase family protein [Flavobacterium sp. Fl-77]|uniref:Vitamin K epoxide reductase family protein n=2 Tax=Flavobacterium flavipigmentatum TaxID=2893884 RepID=A0AAJ2VW46_9FLAO|nr:MULTISPECIES: vitamin K epoxide reductase family protein [unclassified Flavobacterium]MDX6184798.1 vitamin K epoxide reductase family protein [Flavobacterium sp. Fl-77]UFH39895.1 hypothetical protein LNP22_06360 [Flavobacterium sp. F-70]